MRFEEEELEDVEVEEELEVKGKRRTSLRRLMKRQKQEEDEFKPPPVSFLELLKLNAPDWPFVLIGVVFSAIIGCLFPLMAILFSTALQVGEGWSQQHGMHTSPVVRFVSNYSFSHSTLKSSS